MRICLVVLATMGCRLTTRHADMTFTTTTTLWTSPTTGLVLEGAAYSPWLIKWYQTVDHFDTEVAAEVLTGHPDLRRATWNHQDEILTWVDDEGQIVRCSQGDCRPEEANVSSSVVYVHRTNGSWCLGPRQTSVHDCPKNSSMVVIETAEEVLAAMAEPAGTLLVAARNANETWVERRSSEGIAVSTLTTANRTRCSSFAMECYEGNGITPMALGWSSGTAVMLYREPGWYKSHIVALP